MANAISVEGLRELQRAFKRADGVLQHQLRDGLKAAAEPVRVDAERQAVESITRIGVPWSRMRVGVTQKIVYIAPRKRGVKGRDSRLRRPNLFRLLLDSMETAAGRNEARVTQGLERVLDTVGRSFEEKL